MWDLRLKHRARVDRALRDVPDLLMHLEQRGWLDRPLWVLRKSDPVTAASLDRLGVTSLWSQRPTLKHPPGFYLMPESWGGWKQGIEALPAFVSDLLDEPHMAPVRRQLADAEADERHASLLLGWGTHGVRATALGRDLRASGGCAQAPRTDRWSVACKPLGDDTSSRLGSSSWVVRRSQEPTDLES